MANGKERRLIDAYSDFNVLNLVVVPIYALWLGFQTELLEFKEDVSYSTVKEDGNLQGKRFVEMMLDAGSKDFAYLHDNYGEFSCFDVNTKQWFDVDIVKEATRVKVCIGNLPLGILSNRWQHLYWPIKNSMDYVELISYINEALNLWGNKLNLVIQWSCKACNVEGVYLSKSIDIAGNFSYNPGM